MPKDELGNHDALFLVHLDRDTLSVVVYRDLILDSVNDDLDDGHGRVVDLVVGSIDQNLVKYLEEPRNIGDFPAVSLSMYQTYRCTINFRSESNTHMGCVTDWTEPM